MKFEVEGTTVIIKNPFFCGKFGFEYDPWDHLVTIHIGNNLLRIDRSLDTRRIVIDLKAILAPLCEHDAEIARAFEESGSKPRVRKPLWRRKHPARDKAEKPPLEKKAKAPKPPKLPWGTKIVINPVGMVDIQPAGESPFEDVDP